MPARNPDRGSDWSLAEEERRPVMLQYYLVPLLVNDAVNLRYSPSRGRSINSRGVVVGADDTLFVVKLVAGDRILRQAVDGTLVVSRETPLGADLFATVIERMVVREDGGLVFCHVPRTVERLERRRDPRAPIQFPVDVVPRRSGSEGTMIHALTGDLSVGGAQFRTAHGFLVDDTVGLVFELPDGPAPAEAVVVRIEAPQIGGERTYGVNCRITHVEPSVRARLALVVEANLPELRRLSWRDVARRATKEARSRR